MFGIFGDDDAEFRKALATRNVAERIEKLKRLEAGFSQSQILDGVENEDFVVSEYFLGFAQKGFSDPPEGGFVARRWLSSRRKSVISDFLNSSSSERRRMMVMAKGVPLTEEQMYVVCSDIGFVRKALLMRDDLHFSKRCVATIIENRDREEFMSLAKMDDIEIDKGLLMEAVDMFPSDEALVSEWQRHFSRLEAAELSAKYGTAKSVVRKSGL